MNHSSLMSYHEFFSVLSHAILQELGENYEAYSVKNAKNNGIQRNGIVIRQKKEKAAPTIYLDSYYQEYRSGRVLSDIVRHILYTYHESFAESAKYCLNDISLTAEYMQKNLICCIINYQKNQDLLQEIPHIRLFDLAIFFKLLVYQHEDGIGTVRFTAEYQKTFFEGSAVSSASAQLHFLYQLALTNTKRLFPARFVALSDMMEGMLNGMEPTSISFSNPSGIAEAPLYVLTNTKGIGGAACILYPELLNKVQQYLHSDFYIIPSSIHEVLIMPVNSKLQHEQLNAMIREINLTQVPVEDVLSDTAYHSSEWAEVLQALSAQTDNLPYTITT